MRRVGRFAGLALLTGCCLFGGRSGADTPFTPQGDGLMYTVQTTADLLHLRAGYQELLDSAYDGTLEVHFVSGGDAGGGWDLWPERKSRGASAPPAIDLRLVGDGGPLPGTLSRVLARSVRLENLLVTGSRSVALSFEVAGPFTMSRCAVIDGRWTDPHGGEGFLVVEARRGGSEVRVAIEDSWFVRNWQAAPMPMIAVRAAAHQGAVPAEVAVRRSAFLANAFAREVSVPRAASLAVEDSVFFKNWSDGEIFACGEGVPARVTGSVLAVPEVRYLATPSGCPGLDLAGSRLFSPPAPGTAWGARVQDPAGFPTTAMNALLVALADRGRVPDATAWTELKGLLGS